MIKPENQPQTLQAEMPLQRESLEMSPQINDSFESISLDTSVPMNDEIGLLKEEKGKELVQSIQVEPILVPEVLDDSYEIQNTQVPPLAPKEINELDSIDTQGQGVSSVLEAEQLYAVKTRISPTKCESFSILLLNRHQTV